MKPTIERDVFAAAFAGTIVAWATLALLFGLRK